ncbi:hypothetical protein GCM10010840_36960 [Deinococcus aerolatus]|uniref:Uncharacterized protein n=1 Tax=Deinococcus aerolatus TaxID=522487 RepID=A0ABQ2GGK9_9DEIO|nr:hypothetical protein [Deinococcus aerolatus]GGL95496.1 hypothetical protein GCM10010840_36960 [Deinococcus aerolatus]
MVSDEPTSVETFAEYGERFQIEEGFLDEKSGLFELGDSRLRDAASLERLILVLAVATLEPVLEMKRLSQTVFSYCDQPAEQETGHGQVAPRFFRFGQRLEIA